MRLLAALALVMSLNLVPPAAGQVFQKGTIVPQHFSMWAANNSLMDAGTAAKMPQGLQPFELGVTAKPNASGNPWPATATGVGPNGDNVCLYDSPVGIAGHYLCLTANSGGNTASIDIGPLNGGTAGGLQFRVNGTTIPIPGPGGGNVTGPATTAPTHVATWNNTGGTLLADPAFQTAVFTNTQMNEYAASLLNGINPAVEYPILQGGSGNASTDALTGGVAVPGAATVYQADAVAAYANTSSSVTNVVALYGQIRSLAAGTKNWSLNTVCADGGFAIAQCIGYEIDINISSAGTTVANGLSILGASTAQFGAGDAIVVGPPGPGIQWPSGGLVIGDGAAPNAIVIGKATAAGGANLTSQILRWNYTNGASTLFDYQAVVSSSQVLTFNTTAGSGLATVLVDGTLEVNAPTASRADLNFTKNGSPVWQLVTEATNNNLFLFDNANANAVALSIAGGNMILGETGKTITLNGTQAVWNAPTGTPVASLCLDAGGNIIKKTTAGSCI